MGNSEVGHNALGSGQLIAQGARLVDMALEDGSIFKDDGWKYISSAFEANTVHFIGLLSNGGVHSRDDQLHKMLDGCAASGAKRVRLHVLTDGRDVPDGSSRAPPTPHPPPRGGEPAQPLHTLDAARHEPLLHSHRVVPLTSTTTAPLLPDEFVTALKAKCEELSAAGMDTKIASGGGRMGVTMDRYEVRPGAAAITDSWAMPQWQLPAPPPLACPEPLPPTHSFWDCSLPKCMQPSRCIAAPASGACSRSPLRLEHVWKHVGGTPSRPSPWLRRRTGTL